MILAAAFPDEVRGRLETLIHKHSQEAATKEWPMMSSQTATLEIAPRQLIDALQLTLTLTPSNKGQERSPSVRWWSRLSPLSTHAVSASLSADHRKIL
jgi:hypothetical protein